MTAGVAIAAPGLAALAGVRHGFLTRQGGVSAGAFASLNVGYSGGDARANVIENRRRARAAVAPAATALLTARQVHSPRAVVVTEAWAEGHGPEADALVSATPGLALGVTSADCAPILMADAAAGVIAAAHAGWRGALAGVIGATVAAMRELGATPGRMAAAIGPCIGFASYEVGPEFAAPFLAKDAGAARFFAPSARPGHQRFDLPGYVRAELAGVGVGTIEVLGLDTLADTERFFSYRRATLAGERRYGLGVSVIALEG
ncbi:MAG: peptidoglycan editing factor PgeF [Alphaproteobacteria bacterium]|nr:peptidoglycan editing factor PgeF [Alphaproteobacteria bacterium]